MITADALILELIQSNRHATSVEVQIIVAQVAQAPFASYNSRVPLRIREGLAKVEVVCPTSMPNVDWHILERVYMDRQWPIETTAEEYIADLHQAIAHPAAEVWTYKYFNRPYAGFLSPSHVVGLPGSERFLFIAYSPVFGTLTTGYQTADLRNVFTAECTNLVRHR